MSTVQVFDPPMCCSTGICGPEVDSRLVEFAADLDWLASQGITVRRFNLAQEPMRFAETAAVKAMLERSTEDELPAIVVDGVVAASGRYPSRDELARMAGLPAKVEAAGRTSALGKIKIATAPCCGTAAPAPVSGGKGCC